MANSYTWDVIQDTTKLPLPPSWCVLAISGRCRHHLSVYVSKIGLSLEFGLLIASPKVYLLQNLIG